MIKNGEGREGIGNEWKWPDRDQRVQLMHASNPGAVIINLQRTRGVYFHSS